MAVYMPQTIVLNKNNISDTTTNNTLIYKFPISVQFKNNSIALEAMTMYYSWTNINSSPLGNNTFSYSWKVGFTVTTYTVTIPDGLYEISDLNSYLQYKFIANGHYLVNSTSQNFYYAEFLVNATTYYYRDRIEELVITPTLTSYESPSKIVSTKIEIIEKIDIKNDITNDTVESSKKKREIKKTETKKTETKKSKKSSEAEKQPASKKRKLK